MREVHRRTEVARLIALTHLPLGAVTVALTLLADERLKVLSLALFALVVAIPIPAFSARRASRAAGELDRLTSPRATRRVFLRGMALRRVPFLALVGVVAALAGFAFLVPGLLLGRGFAAAIDWWRTARWERAHPSEAQVTDLGLNTRATFALAAS